MINVPFIKHHADAEILLCNRFDDIQGNGFQLEILCYPPKNGKCRENAGCLFISSKDE